MPATRQSATPPHAAGDRLRTPVGDLMRRHWVATEPHASLLEAERLMRLARIRQIPVVVDGVLVGLLAHHALLRASLERLLATGTSAARHGLMSAIPVAAVMDPRPPVLTPDATLRDAAARMLDAQLACLPVCETDDGDARRMVGLVVESDLLRRAYGSAGASVG
ncbi:MAG: hypothetical protein DCC71_12765 [Proteobacteria bacterium]|nr:MAG: hypothetical protein DCC71_12765 [Pseudomonadota bacterium]